MIKQIIGAISKYKYEITLFLGSAIYTLYFTVATFLKHDNFYTGRYDLGNMDQTVWNTIHGRIFQLTDPSVSRLAAHSDFILILLSPLYLIWEDPKMLLLIQSLVLGFGGIFVYAIAWKILKNKLIALIFAFAFYINPAVNFTNLFDFHSVTLATTFFLGAFYFLIQKKYIPMLIFLVLAGITKEQVWAITALFGAYLFLFNKQRKLGVLIFAVSVLIFYYLIWHAIPNARGGEAHFAIEYYSDFGETPSEITKNIIFHPLETLRTLFQKEQMDYLRQLFLPMGYLSVFSPLILVFAAPDLLINLLSQNSQLHQIYYQYSATITPFIFITAILGIKKINEMFPFVGKGSLVIATLLFSLLAQDSYGPLPFSNKPQDEMFKKPRENREVIKSALSQIPKNASVSASNNIGAHLSQRQKIYTIPEGIGITDYVAIYLSKDEKTQQSFKKVSEDGHYVLIFSNKTFYMFRKF
ncbi:MAG: hypothetical protein UU21_C0001G0137 [Candidatus Levybacteria bacterium GW2011_GWA2_40_8]|nr:MAG: hypothetical protein UU21_C0001G0137 [Candidatus Levybacteria bacterium GW2011_GWA2_40_8]